MTRPDDYQVGDCVRLVCDLPVAGAGTEGVIKAINRDDHQQVKAITILVAGDLEHTFGTTVFPREVELVGRAGEVARVGTD